MPRWSFTTKLVRPEGVGTWTFAPIPLDIAQETGIRARLRVKGTIDGIPFRGTLLPGGSGNHFVVVKKELRDRLCKGPGDQVKVKMDIDTAPVSVTVPGDLSRALANDKRARAAFDGMAPSHRKAYVEWITEAKKEETCSDRIAKAVKMIAVGKNL